MARKTEEKAGVLEYRKFGEPTEFVLNNLDDKEKAKLDNAPMDTEVLFQMADKAAELGFVATTKFDAYSKCWQASVVCNAKGQLNTGLAVSGRSNAGVSDALFVALFKLFYVSNGDLTTHAGKSRPKTTRG